MVSDLFATRYACNATLLRCSDGQQLSEPIKENGTTFLTWITKYRCHILIIQKPGQARGLWLDEVAATVDLSSLSHGRLSPVIGRMRAMDIAGRPVEPDVLLGTWNFDQLGRQCNVPRSLAFAT